MRTPPSSAALIAATATNGRIELRGTRSVICGDIFSGADPVKRPRSSESASIDCGRSSGDMARQRITSAPSSRGTSGRRLSTSMGFSVAFLVSTSKIVPPSCGGRPVSISYKIAPTA